MHVIDNFCLDIDLIYYILAVGPNVILSGGQVLSPQLVAGEDLTLSVLVTDFNFPLTYISWTHEGNIIITGKGRDTITNSSLSLASLITTLQRTVVIPLDSGIYVITASNPAGSQVLTFTVNVKGEIRTNIVDIHEWQ